jgi:hypothetical protein
VKGSPAPTLLALPLVERSRLKQSDMARLFELTSRSVNLLAELPPASIHALNNHALLGHASIR